MSAHVFRDFWRAASLMKSSVEVALRRRVRGCRVRHGRAAASPVVLVQQVGDGFAEQALKAASLVDREVFHLSVTPLLTFQICFRQHDDARARLIVVSLAFVF